MGLYVLENRKEENKKKETLNHHLKHLEFITYLEVQLEQIDVNTSSSDFLEVFKTLKKEAQIKVLKYSS